MSVDNDVKEYRGKSFRFRVTPKEMKGIIDTAELYELNNSSFVRCLFFNFIENYETIGQEEPIHDIFKMLENSINNDLDYQMFKVKIT